MIRAVWFVIAICIANVAIAVESTPAVFYPLPTQDQGKVFAAKRLFLADTGGVWLQDVRNQILFFDGQNIMPQSGSALEHDTDQVAFLDNAFWTFFQNEIYRTIPKQERELAFSLKPGSVISRIGSSKRFIWVVDDSNFYTYNIDTGALSSYSLYELYKFSQSSSIRINDAQLVLSKWALATDAGVYLSDDSGFEHVTSSGKNYTETLYYSDKRREIVIGSLKGALVFDITDPNNPVKHIQGSHVLSITETGNEYWIGTEKGLLVYSFLTNETKLLQPSELSNRAIVNGKIYALLNDQAGGVWIATDRGIRYFSLFSHKFERYPSNIFSPQFSTDRPHSLIPMESREGYWMISESGVYTLTLSNKYQKRELIYSGKVYDLTEKGSVLWLATSQGLRRVDVATGKLLNNYPIPDVLGTSAIRFVDIDQQNTLWIASENELWSYQLNKELLTYYGSEWMTQKYLPAQVTKMTVLNRGELILGTEHGVYVLRDGKIHFIRESAPFGLVISIVQTSDNEVWVAGRYGVYKFNLDNRHVQPLTLLDEHITPKCLINNTDGLWLTSSSGLTQYSNQGHLLRHYGEPFGLVSNEFSSGLCSHSINDKNVLLLGSHINLIKVNTRELAVSKTPAVQVIVSQIKVNQQLQSLGAPVSIAPEIDFGESIAFKFGVLPQVNKVSLEYRLNNEDWQLLDGFTLSIEHLIPGQYQLEVRAVFNDTQRGESTPFSFVVAKPWFVTPYALAMYILGFILTVGGIVYWRSKMMRRANRQLRSQVELKTNQLRHQSRILLSNNQQLRKQLQIRRLIVNQSINALKERLVNPTNEVLFNLGVGNRKLVNSLLQELDLLLHLKSTNSDSAAVYNLTLILQSVLDGWEDELTKSGVNIELKSDADCDYFVTLESSNLDELLNLLLDNLVKRCYRNQTVVASTRQEGEMIALSIIDEGEAIDESHHASFIQQAQVMVAQSGGTLNIHASTERNLLEIRWKTSEVWAEESIENAEETDEQTTMDDPWLDRVQQLVSEHYSDPEFSTSTAAKMLYVSERSLQRRLKSMIEKTFTEYLTEVRLDNACRRLLAGEKVSEVAFECGFNDPSYFSQRFKHRFGMSPTQFVEQQDS
ncbi:helix-turn-helix domain-containing protein [Vibrio nereis]|uniref:AraC family transcriptional regulator n=1 Tax=Vibrio nereis TaxID=693 RepID=A0A0M0HJ31_VIBNE|nr:helix-turn-helix domain-containing protein [Vibrio nereis]KOO02084.1 AraC family transcriptional regulator [Vibrio nereis]